MIMTDVEGSTELWEQDSVAADKAIALHDSILRRLLPSYYGFEVGSWTEISAGRQPGATHAAVDSILLSLLLMPDALCYRTGQQLCTLLHHLPDSRGAFAWWCHCWGGCPDIDVGHCL